MADKKTRAELYAEGLREVGILVGVFGVLYALFDGHPDLDWCLAGKMVGWAFGGLVLFHLGVVAEGRLQ